MKEMTSESKLALMKGKTADGSSEKFWDEMGITNSNKIQKIHKIAYLKEINYFRFAC